MMMEQGKLVESEGSKRTLEMYGGWGQLSCTAEKTLEELASSPLKLFSKVHQKK